MPHPSPTAVGIDIGGTKIRSVIIDSCGNVLVEDMRPTPARAGVDAILSEAAESAQTVIDKAAVEHGQERGTIRGVGVGVPGIVDSFKGVGRRAGNLAGWHDVPVCHLIQRRLNLNVRIINDVRAGAYAEWLWGAGKQQSPFVYVNVGTGVAAALIVGGRFYEGAANAAGELGHIILDPHSDEICPGCGQRGDVEALIAGPALAKAYQRVLMDLDGGAVDDVLSPETILHRAHAGEELASSVVRRYVSYVGLAVANTITLYNPRVLVLGGGLGSTAALPLADLMEHARRRAYSFSWAAVAIRQAALGPASGAIGAAAWALHGTLDVTKKGPNR